ncbi:hypothetical protein OIDMADRAFT_186420 [Oidiodendron maius Zn]|uniref:Peptidase A1 domain-containing protein n=1 Tax=Oidiodendron maius (strain Zn) TaxID=913774 RepID=A0A0C3E010_OIDMZ|nr:hypothetical protein OIDMADRAFT_186420 [Oidiodendron maius Zn]
MLAARKDFSASLENEVNQITDSNYIINVQVGTPAQDIKLAIDTGSSDVWVLDSTSEACSSSLDTSSECETPFTSASSSTFKVVDPGEFDITYADGTGAQGDYFTDVLSFGGQSLNAQTMGIATESTLSPGLLGIGYDQNEASTAQNPPFVYSSVIDSLVSQGLISTKAYSLYLDDLQASTGSLLFGGLDSDKYQGNLVQMPIIPQTFGDQSIYTAFIVDMTSFGTTSSGKSTTVTQSSFQIPVVLDSGTTLTYFPTSLMDEILTAVNGEIDKESQFAFVDCSVRDSSDTFTFDFGFGTSESIVIKVPAAELIYDADIFVGGQPNVNISNPCALGFMAQDGEPYVLGDNFLRSAYVVYDLKNNLIALGQTNFDSTTSSILDFPADATTIPVTSGVATSAVVEPSGNNGVSESATPSTDGSGGVPTTFPDPFTLPSRTGNILPTSDSTLSTSSSTSTHSTGPGSLTTPLDLGGLVVIGVSVFFAVLGSGLFLVF